MNRLRYLNGILIKNRRTPEQELLAIENKTENDLAFIAKAKNEIERYTIGMKRAEKRILRNNQRKITLIESHERRI